MSDEHRFQHYKFYNNVEIKTDGCGTFFAVYRGQLLCRKDAKALEELIDYKITLAANTPQEDA